MRQLVSIVVPVYNAENFISECVCSILAQSYKDWELILVNDGSKDSSEIKCREFEQKDSRIKLFSKENGGVSSARNFGIDKASGEYLMFLDSDDSLEKECLEKLINRDFIPDLTIFAFSRVMDGKVINQKQLNAVCSNNGVRTKEILFGMKAEPRTSDAFCFPWNKLFKTELVEENQIRFPLDIHLREDEVFMYRYANVCQSVEVSTECLYQYRITQTGLTFRKRPWEDDVKLANYILSETDNLKWTKDFSINQVKRALAYYFSALCNTQSLAEKRQVCNQMKEVYGKRREFTTLYRYDYPLTKVIVHLLRFPKILFYPLIIVFSMIWKRLKPAPLNV